MPDHDTPSSPITPEHPGPVARSCFWIDPTAASPHGYIPSLVVEGEPGHSPAIGRDDGARPWYWGPTYEQAVATCEQVNREQFGLEPADVEAIVASSIAAQNRHDAAAEDLDRRYRHALGGHHDHDRGDLP